MDTPNEITGALKGMPKWGWAVVVGGGVGIGLYLRHRSSTGASTATTATSDGTTTDTTSGGYQAAGNLDGSGGFADSPSATTTPLTGDTNGLNLPVVGYTFTDPLTGQTGISDGQGGFTSILSDPTVAAATAAANAATAAAQGQVTSLQNQINASPPQNDLRIQQIFQAHMGRPARIDELIAYSGVDSGTIAGVLDSFPDSLKSRAGGAPVTATAPSSSKLPNINLDFHKGDTYSAVSNALAKFNVVLSANDIRGLTNGPASGPRAGTSISIDGARFKSADGKQVFVG